MEKTINNKTSNYFLKNWKCWISFIFIYFVFIITHPFDIFYSIKDHVTLFEITASIEEGSLGRRIGLVLLGFWALTIILRKRSLKPHIRNHTAILTIIFILWSVLSLLWAENHILTLRKIMILLILCSAALAFNARFPLRQIIWFALLSCGFTIFLGFISEILLGTFTPLQSHYRFGGIMHPNAQGWNCSIVILASESLGRISKYRQKLFHIISMFALTFLILTKSRTAFIGLIISVIFFWFLTTRKKNLVLVLFILVFVISGLLLFLGDGLWDISQDVVFMGRRTPSPQTFTGRIFLWKECLHYLAHRPLIGFGYNSFWTSNRVYIISNILDWSVGVAHSGYLEVIMGTGIIGGFLFIFMLLGAFSRSYKIGKIQRIFEYSLLSAILVYYSVASLLESLISSVSLMNFLFLIVLVHLSFFSKKSGLSLRYI